jgi:DNA-binding NtrC family response regulator
MEASVPGEETMATILLVDDEPLQASFRKSALERYFDDVQRVPDAAEALCMVEQPGFARKLGLVIAGHHAPGFGGPAFVHELHDRLPALNVVVIGNNGELPTDYRDNKVYFLPNQAEVDELAAISGFLLEQRNRAA